MSDRPASASDASNSGGGDASNTVPLSTNGLALPRQLPKSDGKDESDGGSKDNNSESGGVRILACCICRPAQPIPPTCC